MEVSEEAEICPELGGDLGTDWQWEAGRQPWIASLTVSPKLPLFFFSFSCSYLYHCHVAGLGHPLSLTEFPHT